MKILLVNTLYTPYQIGGAEKSVQQLAEALVKKNHEVTVITLGKEKEITSRSKVSIFRLKLKNSYWPFDSNPNVFEKVLWHWKDSYNKAYDEEILQIIHNFRPDVLHTHNLGGFSIRIWEIAKQFEIPLFHTLRDYYLMSTSTTNLAGEKRLDFIFSQKRKELSQLVNFVSGISEFVLDAHLKNGYFKNASSKTIYNGFEFNQLLEQKSINKNIVFGFIGQVKEHKGINILLKSFLRLNKVNTKLLIAGEAPDYLVRLYKDKENIQFKGFVKSEDFMKEIDVLVVPSLWHEPFGRVVMEAIAHKTFVIGSKMGGIPELLKNNQEFLFDPHEDSLFELMNMIISNPDFLTNFKFDSGFLQEFTLDSMVNQYESVYKSLILRADEN